MLGHFYTYFVDDQLQLDQLFLCPLLIATCIVQLLLHFTNLIGEGSRTLLQLLICYQYCGVRNLVLGDDRFQLALHVI